MKSLFNSILSGKGSHIQKSKTNAKISLLHEDLKELITNLHSRGMFDICRYYDGSVEYLEVYYLIDVKNGERLLDNLIKLENKHNLIKRVRGQDPYLPYRDITYFIIPNFEKSISNRKLNDLKMSMQEPNDFVDLNKIIIKCADAFNPDTFIFYLPASWKSVVEEN